jgi:hypothetical protein
MEECRFTWGDGVCNSWEFFRNVEDNYNPNWDIFG